MRKFISWIRQAEYTPFGNVFDMGNICYRAIAKYELLGDIDHCGCDKDYENGNGSLMRILPACLQQHRKCPLRFAYAPMGMNIPLPLVLRFRRLKSRDTSRDAVLYK